MLMRRLVPCVLIWVGMGAARAASTTMTYQRGLNGYDGVGDTFLYAPSSVANINYGKSRHLNAGINRWNEHYVTLIRFDLRGVPKAARVVQVSLWLFDASKTYPARDLTVDIQAITPANTDWDEGSGDGTRVPIPNTTCWNYRRYDTARWAGAPGLRKAGVDYMTPTMGSSGVKKGHTGWVEFSLDAAVVQGWVRDPKTNAGMRIFPLSAKQKSDVFGFPSSEAADVSRRPKLVVKIEMDEATAEVFRRGRAIARVDPLSVLLSEVRATVGAAGDPPRAVGALQLVAAKLKAAGEDARAKQMTTADDLKQFLTRTRQLEQEIRSVPDVLTIARAEAANKARKLATDFALGIADGTRNVVRGPGLFGGPFSDTAQIELAKNEFEPVQIVIVPIDADVRRATWSVTPLRGPGQAVIPAEDVSIAVMGYLKSRKPAVRTAITWWPGPILDFMKHVDVPKGKVQPLWVCVRTRGTTQAGAYQGTVTVRGENVRPKTIALRVRVYDFAVPKAQHLLTVWGNNEPTYKALYGDRYDKKMARAMFDFLIDHRLAVNTLYAAQSAGKPIAGGWFTECIGYPTLSDPAELRRLWEAGSRWWNLGYLHPVFAKSAKMDFDAYVPKFIEMLRASLEVADAAGWPRSNLGIYFFDETREFETLNKAASKVKAAFPDIPLMTTGYDRSYGVKGGPIDKSIDIWCPLTPRFAQDAFTIGEGRRYGKKAWWYVCCGPRGSKDLNFFSQFPAIRSRLLMGAATWKYRPDGFLYYRISGWRNYKKPITTGPLTDWTPYYLPGPDGDGELICPGPNGPLSTLQFENIRDGIEDYEYYWVLSDLVARAKKRGMDVTPEEKLLHVPADLLSTLTSYSEEPARLLAERRKIAEAIVRLARRVEGRHD